MSENWSRFLIFLFSLTILTTLSLEASAGYKEDYQNAVKRIQQRNYQQGLNLLERIPEIEQQELAALSVGSGKSIVYLPKYYKGLAAFNLGKCELAERNLISSLAQQVIKRIKAKHERLKKMREVCRSRLVDGKYIDKLASLTKTAIDKTRQLTRNRALLNKLKKDPLLRNNWSKNSYFQARLNETNQRTNLANKELDEIKLMPYSTKNRDHIVRLNARLSSQIKNAEQHVRNISNYRDSFKALRLSFEKIDKALDELTAVKANAALSDDWKETGNLNQSLLKLTEEKQNLVSQSKTLVNFTDQEELSSAIVTSRVITRKADEISQQLNSLLGSAKSKIAVASSNLEREKQVIYRGANAFFSGSYGKAIMVLSQAELKQDRSRYFQNLFLAAAYFNDPELKDFEAAEKARPYIKAAKSIQLKEDFDEDYFSPKFINFFREVHQ